MRTSCIAHPKEERLVIIHQWQVEVCEGDVTAAALLSFFEYWHNLRLEIRVKAQRANEIAQNHGDKPSQDDSLLQFHSEQDLIDGVMIAKRDTIRKGIKLLEGKGFVSIHRNPNPRYAFDKTRYFLFHTDPVNEWLEQYSNRTSENRTSENRPSKSKNQLRSSENQSPSSKTTSAITEITPETTPEKESPLTPLTGEPEKDGGGDSLRCEEEPGRKQNLPALSKQNTEAALQTKDPVVVKNSAAAPPPTEKPKQRAVNGVTATGDVAAMFLAGIAAGTGGHSLNPWQLSNERNDYDPEFVESIRTEHLNLCTRYRENGATTADAQNWITGRQRNRGELSIIQARWDDFAARRKTAENPAIAPEPRYHAIPDDYPNFPTVRLEQHEKWVVECLEIGEEAFKAKYPWYGEWIRCLGHFPPYRVKLLSQIIAARGLAPV